MEASIAGFAVLFGILFLGVPIAFGMGLVGFVGFGLMIGWAPASASVGQITVDSLTSYGLSVLPLFLLMGNFINQARLSEELYAASNAFVGHWRGGLSIATIVACGGFSAVCGSSLATAATMARIAMPSMRRYGYDEGLASGSIAAGGTLGILIPPSIILVIYGNMTETDIGKLFIAGVLPGVLGIALYALTVALITRLRPASGPPGPRTGWQGRMRALRAVWGVAVLFVVVLGGIYLGVFTPTEAAGIGAGGAFLFALARGALPFDRLVAVLIETAATAAKLLILVVGAALFSNFINVAGLPAALADWIVGLAIPPIAVAVCIMVAYIVLGCILDGLSIILLTVPVVYPLVQSLGFDLVWFGIVLVVVTEVGLITPPIGLNVFVIRSVLPEVRTAVIFRGVVPFIGSDVVRLGVLILFPGIVLYLPSLMW